MSSDTVSILDGNTFVVSDRRGDLDATPLLNHGLFLEDTRFLSRWILSINGVRPKLLSLDDTAYFRVCFFSALATSTIYVDSHVSVARRRDICGGFSEQIEIVNHGREAVDLDVVIEVDADFADLFEVKDKLAKKGLLQRRVEDGKLIFAYQRESFRRETHVLTSQPAEIGDGGLHYRVRVDPHGRWQVILLVEASFETAIPRRQRDRAHTPAARKRDLDTWLACAPKLVCPWRPLERIYQRSLSDLAALRFHTPITKAAVPAAGLPWFMTIFGRDSLLTSFQTLPFYPQLAAATLDTLALFQGQCEDAFRDEEPGKILHEMRLGELTAFEERPHSPYYGAADTTPLFLIVLEEYVRWSGDQTLARKLERNVRAALSWIDDYGDRDGDGYVEYERRNPHTGLENQCWKDSWDAIAFADGTLAPTPRATCEIQGYVYDAKRRVARLARDVYGDPVWANELEREATDLKARFNRDFWLRERGFFALALDRDKRQVDALSSNIGHLLWSGIVDDDKVHSCVVHLMSDALFSGWGVRTMAVTEGSYNPIGYHVGTVWPHDTSIIAWGLRRTGHREQAGRLACAMLQAAELFGNRLPEAFGGYPRKDTHYPVEYPTACSPQAWAAGAPLLLLRSLLGLDSDGRHLFADPALPELFEQIALLDIPGAWGHTDVLGRARPARPVGRASYSP